MWQTSRLKCYHFSEFHHFPACPNKTWEYKNFKFNSIIKFHFLREYRLLFLSSRSPSKVSRLWRQVLTQKDFFKAVHQNYDFPKFPQSVKSSDSYPCPNLLLSTTTGSIPSIGVLMKYFHFVFEEFVKKYHVDPSITILIVGHFPNVQFKLSYQDIQFHLTS